MCGLARRGVEGDEVNDWCSVRFVDGLELVGAELL